MKRLCILFLLLGFTTNFSIAEQNSGEFEDISENSLVGRLWLPDSLNSNPAILLLGGSGGGYENQDAQWLSAAGFVVFNVRYFGGQGLPANLVKIPIEYFNTAIRWLNNHPSVTPGKTGVFGHSRGTEAAILTSHYNPLVEAVVLRSPSAVVWSGPGWQGYNESAWTWKNTPLPFLNMGIRDGAVWLSKILLEKKLIKTRPLFENALHDLDSIDQTRLPVDEIDAHLLLISGSDDQQWPSAPMADILVNTVKDSNSTFSVNNVVFENAGHRPGYLSQPDDTFANGGTVEGNVIAHKQTKILVKEFFDNKLR